MIDTISDFPSAKIGSIRKLANHFGLELYRNPLGEPEDCMEQWNMENRQ
jgi:hypothetical protein